MEMAALRLMPSSKDGEKMVELSRLYAVSKNPQVHYDISSLTNIEGVDEDLLDRVVRNFGRGVKGEIFNIFYAPERVTITWASLDPKGN